MGNVTTTTLMKSNHNRRKKCAEDKIPIPRVCETKDDALDRSELIFDEQELEEAEENIYQ